jgi:oleate hydratase
MNHAHSDRTAYLVGGGIATLAAAVYLVRDGHFQGRNIAILEEATLGGSLDAGGSAQQGYAMRGKVGIGFGVACAGLS